MTSLREKYEAATRELQAPFAMVDLAAFRANAAALTRRAHGRPIRVASKSVRCRELLRAVLELPGYEGVMAFTLPEALWLAQGDPGGPVGRDILVAYPTTDTDALARNLDAIAANWRKLEARAVPAECAGVVKANAYGCCIEPVTRALGAAAALSVARRFGLDQALRRAVDLA
jgi:D-serine deaminase-like pyridoxal phosphate-dependent protein